CNLGLNLNRELTGGSKNKDDGAVTRSKERLSIDMNDSRKTVGQSLARTSFSNTNNIATGESHGPALGLNGSGPIKSLRLDLSQDVLGETSFVKSLNGTRDVPAVDGHFIALAELVNIALGTVGD